MVPMFNDSGVAPLQRRPDYCAKEQNGRSKHQRSLRDQPELAQNILNELLKHPSILTDRGRVDMRRRLPVILRSKERQQADIDASPCPFTLGSEKPEPAFNQDAERST